MRSQYIAYAVALTVCASPVAAQTSDKIQPNSQFFSISNYLYPDGRGGWIEYRAAGFAQPAVTGVPARLFLMPQVRLTRGGVKFTDATGNPFDPEGYPTRRAKAVGVTAGFDMKLPDERQLPAIGAALSGVSVPGYLSPWPTLPNGDPVMHPAAAMDFNLRAAIMNNYQSYKAETEKVKGFADKYAGYLPTVATLTQLRIALIVDGDEVAAREFDGASILFGTLPQVTVNDPTLYVQNKLASDDFEMLVSYRFLDANIKSIQATFNTRQALKQFVEETQKAITTNKSSGWQVLGFGSRRSKVKTSLEQSMKSDTVGGTMQGTTIVMYDATDDMVDRFEELFFPQLSRTDVIERHLAAAAQAEQTGNLELAKVHRDYVAALQADDKMKEVDTVAAAASLAAGDYVGFVANGVRMSASSNMMTNNFRRVVDVNVETVDERRFTEVKTQTVLRQTNLPVAMEEKKRYRPSIGLLNGATYAFPYVQQNAWGQPELLSRTGLLATGVMPGGALWGGGILSGAVITAIGDYTPTNLAELEDALAKYDAGETIKVKILALSGRLPTPFAQGQWGQEQTVTVKLGRRPAPPAPEDS